MSTHSEARNEYLKQLSTWVVPYMIQHYRNVWYQSSKGGQQKVMVIFQERCAEVPKWNQDTIDENVGKLMDSCRCDYLEELMAAVFIAHTKVLISIRVNSKHKKLQITLPKLDHFIHRVFSECARSFWKAPYLFLDDQKPIEMQKNLLQAEALCNDAIGAAVRSLLPIKNILKEYLSEDVLSSEPVIEDSVKGGSSEKDLADKEVAEKDLADKETALHEVAIKELAERELADKMAAEKEAADKEAADKEAAYKEAADKEAADKEAADKEAADKEAADKEAVSKEAVEKEAVEKIAVSKEPVEKIAAEENDVKEVVIKSGSEDSKPVIEEPEEILIETEPASVHFSNYDNVFDENSEQVGTFAYVPKDLEPGELPKIEIKEEQGSPLSLDSSVTDLDAPGDLADEVLE